MSSTESQNYRVNVVKHDGVLRFMVPSRQKGKLPYLVQLDSWEGNGQCVCRDFVVRKEPLLRRGMTCEEVVAQNILKVPSWGMVPDVLRCFHIHAARLKFADDVIAAIMAERGESQNAKENQGY